MTPPRGSPAAYPSGRSDRTQSAPDHASPPRRRTPRPRTSPSPQSAWTGLLLSPLPPRAERGSLRMTPPRGSPAAYPSGRSDRTQSAPDHASPPRRRTPRPQTSPSPQSAWTGLLLSPLPPPNPSPSDIIVSPERMDGSPAVASSAAEPLAFGHH